MGKRIVIKQINGHEYVYVLTTENGKTTTRYVGSAGIFPDWLTALVKKRKSGQPQPLNLQKP